MLYLDTSNENNMFDFKHNNKVYYESEMLGLKLYSRSEKYDLKFCEDAILDLIGLTVNKIDKNSSRKLVY